MKVMNDLLQYNNLKIYQDTDMFSFSLDSVLLANFVKINKNTNKILDIGTGNAVIPMILSTKTRAKIKAVEIQKEVFTLGKESIEYNQLEEQIEIINQDVNEYVKEQQTDQFDIITCNPPFFKDTDTSNKNSSIHKTIARHEIFLTLEDITKISKKLLKNNGSLYMVHRPDRLTDIIMCLQKNNLRLKRLRFIYPKKDRESNIVLIQATKNGKSGLKVLSPLYVHLENGNYTQEVLKYFK